MVKQETKKIPKSAIFFGIEEKSIFPCLVLFFSPPPHVAEHVVQALHSPTSQSTELDLKQNLWPCQPTLWTACSIAISLVGEMEICTSLTTVQSISNLFPARERRGASIGLFVVISITRLVGNDRVFLRYSVGNQHPHPIYTLLLPTSLVMTGKTFCLHICKFPPFTTNNNYPRHTTIKSNLLPLRQQHQFF